MHRTTSIYQLNSHSKASLFFAVAIGIFALLSLAGLPAAAQITPQGAIEIEPGGKLWIEGSASIVDYTCRAEQLSGNGSIENATQPQQNVKGHGGVSIQVSIPVKSLECGKRGMNKDMYEALKAEAHETIRYRLLSAEFVNNVQASADENDNWMKIETIGVLEIAGVKDTTHVPVQGQLINEDRFRVKGSKQINMDTYDIEPPTAMFGLIKASRKLTVHFDVTVQLKNASDKY